MRLKQCHFSTINNKWMVTKFSIVGSIGFVSDLLLFYILYYIFSIEIYLSRGLSIVGAITITWYLNRIFTFSDKGSPKIQQWFKYLFVNLLGGIANYTVFVFLVGLQINVLLSLILSTSVGFIFNFNLSKKFIFNRKF